jgi:homocysteine S-methyltransferase
MTPIGKHSPGKRQRLPQTSGTGLFVTDGGLETELIFHDRLDLPCFAAFPLLDEPDTRATLRRYYDRYLAIAREYDAGFVVETPTWRANPDWAERLGYSPERLDAANRAAVELAEEVRTAATAAGITAVVSGCVGPRGDGYDPGEAMTPDEAERYHAVQIGTFADTTADQVTAITLTNAEEAIGVVRAAAAAGIPAAISFTVETDGRLPTGQPLPAAIEQVDTATEAGAAYFMVNCAHPTHFAKALEHGGRWRERLLGLRANASTKSHAELDESTELDEGDPTDLAARHAALRHLLPAVTVLGGCCGTDARHVAAICSAWTAS